MPQIINTNISALTIQNNLNASQGSLATSLQRLSSGLRINSAKDDAAGLAISARMSSQIGGLDQAGRNANDAISLSQTADGALAGAADSLNTIRSLAIQSANFTNSASDRAALQQEALALTNEIQRVATTTQFNGNNILDGTLSNAQFQIGANAGQTVTFAINNAQTTAIGNEGFQGQSNTASSVAAATATSTIANNRIALQTYSLIVNGNTATFTTTAAQSVQSVAANLNLLSQTTGITALAQTAAGMSVSATGTVGFTISSGGVNSAVVSAAITSTSDMSALANAVNAQSAVTGIFASSIPGFATLTLTNAQGTDIQVNNFIEAGGSATVGGSNAYTGVPVGANVTLVGTSGQNNFTTVGGELQLNSPNIYSLTSAAVAGASSSGLVTTSNPQFSTLSALSTVNIGTVSGANAAIAIIDAALANINSIRGGLGALQNRFTSTIANLQTASQNLSAARSRIQDADFASETTNLSRSQVLQQAGTAMLAQANALPDQVLTLLR
jgi:flagellin